MREINCLGDFCPTPLLKLEKWIAQKKGNEIMLVTDHSCVCESVKDYCRKMGFNIEVFEPVNGVWEFIIRRK